MLWPQLKRSYTNDVLNDLRISIMPNVESEKDFGYGTFIVAQQIVIKLVASFH